MSPVNGGHITRTHKRVPLTATDHHIVTVTPLLCDSQHESSSNPSASRKAVADGFTTIKLKVGANLDADRRRLQIARNATGPDTAIAIDANQRWSVPDAINAIQQLAEFDGRWVEEPTHPDDVVGHATIAKAVHPVPIATGEHLANPTLATLPGPAPPRETALAPPDERARIISDVVARAWPSSAAS